MPYEVNLETCEVFESPAGTLTRKSAALLAYHLAGEKMNHWSAVKSDAWAMYAEEVENARAAGVF